jgi:N-acetylglucosaminyldiphosphoundecaprenol N-acetyl-beta-D-mannosaminyltransferase
MQKHPLLSLNLSIGSYCDFINEIMSLTDRDLCSEYVCVSNVHMLVEAHRNAEFRAVVNRSAITTADGVPLTWGLRWLYGIRQARVAGMDLLPDLLSAASEQRKSVFFYGGAQDRLEQAKRYVGEHYPGIPEVGIYSPPFRPLTPAEEADAVTLINDSGAKLVFVILGCPKQERWMASMQGRINAVMIGLGAALSILIGERKRAPKWIRDLGMEWFYRLLQEPQRLWKRYLSTNFTFLYLLAKAKIQH